MNESTIAPEPIRACVDRRTLHVPAHAPEMAAQTVSLWTPGQTLRIAFRDGTRAQRNAIMAAAQEWMRYANIRIVQTSGDSEGRCTFEPGGSWSTVGRDALLIPADEPNMNMGWLNDPGRDLHELGHFLGLVHEHQAALIDWNEAACYQFYGAPPNNWTPGQVREQVFRRYGLTTLTQTAWDGKSIMEYPIPRQLVRTARFVAGWNQFLSSTDKSFIGKLYPGVAA